MEIIDAQVHSIFPWRRWDQWSPVPDFQTRARITLELMMASMDAVGVSAALVNPSVRPDSNAWARLAVRDYPERFRIAKTVDALAPDVESQVAAAVAEPGVIAIRAHLNDWRNHRGAADLEAGLMDRLFPAIEEAGVPLFCFMLGDLHALPPFVRNYPGVKFIVDHLGLLQGPVMTPTQPRWAHLDRLIALADYPNVAVKLCGPEVLAEAPYPFPDVWPYLHQVFDAYGANRVMWASDFTRMRMGPPEAPWAAQLGQSVGYVRDTDQITDQQKEWIFGRSLRSWLNWQPPERPLVPQSYWELH